MDGKSWLAGRKGRERRKRRLISDFVVVSASLLSLLSLSSLLSLRLSVVSALSLISVVSTVPNLSALTELSYYRFFCTFGENIAFEVLFLWKKVCCSRKMTYLCATLRQDLR